MPDEASRPTRREWVRAILGPVALATVGALQGVTPTGPVTVALSFPRPPVTLVVGHVLAALALTTFALAAAGSLARARPPMVRLALSVAASQLPMALVALLVGATMLGRSVVATVGRHGEELLKQPTLLLRPLGLPAVSALVLAALAVGLLLYGYEQATRARGWRLYGSFVGGLVAAEVICRVWFRFAG